MDARWRCHAASRPAAAVACDSVSLPSRGPASREHGKDFGVEVLGNPSIGSGWYEPGQGLTSPGVGDDLDSDGRVDDDGCHTVVSSRSSRTAWAASRLSMSGSGPRSNSSSKSWNASGEQSSSGLVTTTVDSGGPVTG